MPWYLWFCMVIIALAVLANCSRTVNGHYCELNSRNMDCMLMEGRL